ncbi:hypothetical protein Heshes_21210 [Alicyclobacillus hesperidum]|uniref:Uncharacterized protein n=1 Tax=Alicyclobacillus hesperidum TaxID=89784 RepID=A0AA37X4B3_9BACL|nr:hypothetical protein [Alicyclobacillus hesperidum]GLV14437.1 hypothetical protein Heshes_21210 [Alicyclobacillus hesperidum]
MIRQKSKMALSIIVSLAVAATAIIGVRAAALARPAEVIWKTVDVREPAPYPTLPLRPAVKLADLSNASVLTASPSGNMLALLTTGGQLQVVAAQSGVVIDRVQAQAPIVHVTWISDRLLFLVTADNVLYTDDVLNQRIRAIAQLHVPAGESLRQIALSTYTNDVFVIYASDAGNTVFQFDTNEHMYERSFGDLAIRRAYYSATALTLYLSDVSNHLYQWRAGFMKPIATDVTIVAGRGNTLYCASLDGRGQALAVKSYDGSRWHTIVTLQHPVAPSAITIDHAGQVYVMSHDALTAPAQGLTWLAPQGAHFTLAGHDILLVRGNTYRVIVD